MVRFPVNGRFDTSFGTAGLVTSSIPFQITSIFVQADGKILASGFTNVESQDNKLQSIRKI